MNTENEKVIKIISFLGLSLIAFFSLGYSIFWISFAKIHVYLPWVDLPVFVGEILLGICLILVICKWKLAGLKLTRWHIVWAIYIFWMLLKTAEGYINYGPLSFRHAALFYYPVFAFLAYQFYSKEIINRPNVINILFLLLAIKAFLRFDGYYLYPYLLLTVLGILQLRTLWIKLILFALLIGFIYPVYLLFVDSKTIVVGHITAIFFVLTCLILMLRFSKNQKIAGTLIFCVIFIVVFARFTGKEKIRALSTPTKLWQRFKEKDQYIQEAKKTFKQRKLKVNLYNASRGQFRDIEVALKLRDQYSVDHDQDAEELEDVLTTISMELHHTIYKTKKSLEYREEYDGDIPVPVSGRVSNEVILSDIERSSEILKTMRSIADSQDLKSKNNQQAIEETNRAIKDGKASLNRLRTYYTSYTSYGSYSSYGLERDVNSEYDNMLFRIYIWRDMIEEWQKETRLFTKWMGFSFGKPQRSISVEIINIGVGEWSRDGWITPHNSYLHILYRSGIVGVFILIALFSAVVNLFIRFMKLRSMNGILLMSMIVYWTTIACFAVFLEFPYQAIPFWSFLGLTAAYLKNLEGQHNGKIEIRK